MKMRVLHDLQYGENEFLLLLFLFFFLPSTYGNIQLFFFFLFFFFLARPILQEVGGAVRKYQEYFVPNNFVASR